MSETKINEVCILEEKIYGLSEELIPGKVLEKLLGHRTESLKAERMEVARSHRGRGVGVSLRCSPGPTFLAGQGLRRWHLRQSPNQASSPAAEPLC